jgi:AraC-like DNA-binding protein
MFKNYSNRDAQDLSQARQAYSLDTDLFSVEVEPTNRQHYRADAETAALGALNLALVTTNGAVVSRKHEMCTDENFKRYSLLHVLEGDVVVSHPLGISALKAGDFTLLDNSLDRKMLVYDRVKLLLVNVPCQVLQRYIAMPEVVVAQTLHIDETEGDAIFLPILRLWEPLKQGSLREFAPSISDRFLRGIAHAYSGRLPPLGNTAIRRVTEAKQFVEANLSNPELSIETVATEMGVSSRYLRGLFQHTEKLSHYILRRRLEESASQLGDASNRYVSITAIALRCGFNSPSHFSRSFLACFGHTPRKWRNMQGKRVLQ